MTAVRDTSKMDHPEKGLSGTQSTHLYQLLNVKKYHKSQLAVDIESLTISKGSITGLIGPNGSGKSSLLRLLAFVDSPSKGSILFKGQRAAPFDISVRFQVSLLPQEPYLMKRSVFDNIAYGLTLRGISRSLHTKSVSDALEMVGLHPREFATRPWYQLSGGEAQRVALAARLVLRPDVLLLDEPTASVDAASAQQIKACALKACREWGTALIVASHDWQWVHEICGTVISMLNGRIVENGEGNILWGPWHPGPDGFWEKVLEDNQAVRVSAPPSPTAVAVIPRSAATFSRTPALPQSPEHSLLGVLTRLALDPESGAVHVTLRIAELNFTFPLAAEIAQAMNLFPGQQLYLTYSVSAIVWH